MTLLTDIDTAAQALLSRLATEATTEDWEGRAAHGRARLTLRALAQPRPVWHAAARCQLGEGAVALEAQGPSPEDALWRLTDTARQLTPEVPA